MQKPGIKTILITSAVLLVLILLFVKGCGKSRKREFFYEKVTRGEIKKTIAVTGELDVLDPVMILCKTAGIIENVYTDFNQKVYKGQLLIKMDSSVIDQKILKAESLVEGVKYEISSAERELEGKKSLFNRLYSSAIFKKRRAVSNSSSKTNFQNCAGCGKKCKMGKRKEYFGFNKKTKK